MWIKITCCYVTGKALWLLISMLIDISSYYSAFIIHDSVDY